MNISARPHFKGGYTAQQRVVVSNNGFCEYGDTQAGLFEYDGKRWGRLRVIRPGRRPYRSDEASPVTRLRLCRLRIDHGKHYCRHDHANDNRVELRMAERVGFEPTYSLLGRNPISSRTRYDLFGTSPAHESTKNPRVSQTQSQREARALTHD